MNHIFPRMQNTLSYMGKVVVIYNFVCITEYLNYSIITFSQDGNILMYGKISVAKCITYSLEPVYQIKHAILHDIAIPT